MTTIKLKNGSGAPTAGDLAQGEPALDLTNKRLYTEDSGGTVIEVGTNPGVDVTFADDRKAIFGAGSDLQIYHDGSNSYITDAGTGDLRIRGANVEIQTGGGNKYFQGAANVASLYHTNNLKLATTSTGIDVTGTVTADGLTVDGGIDIAQAQNTTNQFTSPHLALTATSTTDTTGFTGISYASSSVANYGWTVGALRNTTGNNSDFVFNLHNNSASGSEKMRIDGATGNVGIGTSSVDSLLHLSSSSGPELRIENTDTALTEGQVVGSLVFEQNDSTSGGVGISGRIQMRSADRPDTGTYFGTAADMDFLVSGASSGAASDGATKTAMTIRAGTGNVGIGTSSPDTLLHLSDTAGGAVIRLERNDTTIANTDVYGEIQFEGQDASAGSAAGIRGKILGVAEGATGEMALAFQTAGGYGSSTERMRIDSSGNLLVGTTDRLVADGTGTGLVLGGQSDLLHASRSGGDCAKFNRVSDDGAIVTFAKDGTPVGQINARSGDLVIGTGTTGLQFYDVGNAIFPLSASGNTNRDAAIDLGETSNRFKDLYLSGGVYLGGTGSANHLDDYEEGTFTGAVSDASSGGNESSSVVNGTYVKVGAVVYVQFNVSNIITTGMTAGNDVFITGLPFVTKSVSGTAKYTGTANLSVVTFEQTPFMQVNEGQAYVKILEVRSGAGNDAVVVSQLSSGASDIHGNLVYETA